MVENSINPSWRGINIRSKKDVTGKYLSLIGPKALLYIPVNVDSNVIYRITIELKNVSGNGIVYCNIFGNRQFDFPQATIKCINGDSWATYDVDLKTGSFPNTLPLIFRIWRDPSGTGEIGVKKIIISLLENKNEVSDPKLISVNNINQTTENSNSKPKVIRKKIIKKIVQEKEFFAPTSRSPSSIQPKKLPIMDNLIKVSVVISVFNRIKFLERTLITYVNQTLPKENFEIIIVDDQSHEDIRGLCKKINTLYGIQFQYILFDKMKGAIKPKTFVPALSNNIGFKKARGSVIIITGPETLQKETNLEIAWKRANEGYCVYGNVYRSGINFVKYLEKNENCMNLKFDELINIEDAKKDKTVFNGWWWYFAAARKEHILAINGVNEKFMEGISGEDDDFAKRIEKYGVPLIRDGNIIGIHQDHTEEDQKCATHSWRFDKKSWRNLRRNNEILLNEWQSKKLGHATNIGIKWGTFDAIIDEEVL